MTDPSDVGAVVARLRELLAKATARPWGIDLEAGSDNFAVSIYGPTDDYNGLLVARVSQNGWHNEDATLIAEAVNALPAILSERDALIAAREGGGLPSVEDLATTIRLALVEDWHDIVNARKWQEDILLTGCRRAGHVGYEKPEQAAQNLAMDAATAILQLLARPGRGGWLPIESAPRDGTDILGCVIGKCADGGQCYGWIADGYLDGEEWTFVSMAVEADEYTPPTHWQPLLPLPEPPAEPSADRTGEGR
jgi:hypothetical protein